MKNVFVLTFVLILSVEFTTHSQNWYEAQKTVAFDRESFAEYGVSVSISDSTAVVGAYLEDKDSLGLNPIANSGAVYVYLLDEFGVWNFQQKLISADREVGDKFGNSVSISEDYIVVGAVEEDEDELGLNTVNSAGSVYIFKKNSSGNWVQIQKIVASDRAASDYFGISTRIHENQLVVGAHEQNYDENGNNILLDPGAAYIFELDTITGIWSEMQKIVASDRNSYDWFGYSVSIFENTIVVGAYQNNFDVTGSNNLNDAGSVYIFEKDTGSGVWFETQKIVASDRQGGDLFGGIVSVWDDWIIVGAKSQDLNTVGASPVSGAGAVYVFKKDNQNVWAQSQKVVAPIRAVGDNYGNDVSIHKNYFVVSAPNEDQDALETNTLTNPGAVYIYENSGLDNWTLVDKVATSDREAFDMLFAVAISDNNIITGTTNEDHDESGLNFMSSAGSVYFLKNDCPIILTAIDYSICEGDSILLAGAYQNSPGYYLETLSSVSCSDSIISNYLAIIPSQFGFLDTTICIGDSVFAQGAYQFTAGIYYDTLQTIVGCDSIISTDVSLKSIYLVNQNITICFGDSLFVGGNFQSSPGIFTDTLVSNQCYDSLLNTNLSLFTVALGINTINSTTLGAINGGEIYQWLDCDNNYSIIPGETNQQFIASTNGNYAVEITDNGCVDTSACTTIQGIGWIENSQNFAPAVYPNPTTGVLNILANQGDFIKSVVLINCLGEVVFKDTSLEVSQLNMSFVVSPGIYMLEVSTISDDKFIYKIVVN